jgi:hypothetical protein
MDGTRDGRGNRDSDAGAGAVAGLAGKLMRLAPVMLRIIIWFVLPVTAVSAAAMELPSRAGAVPFDHGGHIAYEQGSCTVCHHTSTGSEVRETCRQCHRPSAPSMPDSRSAFHGSCIGCHEDLRRDGKAAGPTKRCSGCHQKADVDDGGAQRP